MDNNICKVEGCCKPVKAKGFCGTHHQRYRRNGDPIKVNKRGKGTLRPGVVGKCYMCNNRVYYQLREVEIGRKKFCSKECFSKYHSVCVPHPSGEASPFYIKDRNKIKNQFQSIRDSKMMKDWKKSVHEKYNYTCQMCGDRSRSGHYVKLNAHHIVRFIDAPELRFNVNNGITLCVPCHEKTRGKEKMYEDIFKEIVNYNENSLKENSTFNSFGAYYI